MYPLRRHEPAGHGFKKQSRSGSRGHSDRAAQGIFPHPLRHKRRYSQGRRRGCISGTGSGTKRPSGTIPAISAWPWMIFSPSVPGDYTDFVSGKGHKPSERFLEKGLFLSKREKLLGHSRPRQGPEPHPPPARITVLRPVFISCLRQECVLCSQYHLYVCSMPFSRLMDGNHPRDPQPRNIQQLSGRSIGSE